MTGRFFHHCSSAQYSWPLPLIKILVVVGMVFAFPAFGKAQGAKELSAESATATICRSLQNATVRVLSNNDRSSGVIVSEEGHVLTVAHGLHTDGTKVVIVFHDGSNAVAEIVLCDKTLDVAVLKLLDKTASPKLIPISIAPSSPLHKKALVLAAGYPGREPDGLRAVIRLGELLAIEPTTLRSSCTLTAGDSGGPLVNHLGQLIGLHRQIGLSRESNHHLPLQRIKETVMSVLDPQKQVAADASTQNTLTATLPAAKPAVTEALRLRRVAIHQTKPSQQDDVVPRVAGTLLDAEHVATKLSELTPNTPIDCRFNGGDRCAADITAFDVELDLAILKLKNPRSTTTSLASLSMDSTNEFSLVYVATSQGETLRLGLVSRRHHNEIPLNGKLGALLEVDDTSGAVRVRDVAPNSTASEAGLFTNCLIDSINDQPVATLDDVGALLMKHQPGDWLQFGFRTGDQKLSTSARLRHDPAEQFERTEFLDGRSGVVSERRSGFADAIQHDIELSPSDCGSPLVDSEGRVIGINIARRARESSLAIPIESAIQLLETHGAEQN